MITLAVAVGLVVALYLYLTRTFGYWQKRGVQHDAPWPLFGTNVKNYLLQASGMQVVTEIYQRYPGEKVVGHYKSSTPELIIRDPAIAKRVLISDFAYFHRRGFYPPGYNIEPIESNQFAVEDDMWRLLRLRMTPAFSSGKLKAMFPLIVERAERLQVRLRNSVGKEQAIDARELMARYTTDVIGSVGFGIPSDSLNDDNDPFRQLGVKLLAFKFSSFVKFALKATLPKYTRFVKLSAGMGDSIVKMVQGVMQKRNYEPCGRKDFIDLLLECRKEPMTGDSIIEVNPDGTPKKVSMELDDSLITAQVLVFFVAGFETSSSATSYTLHQLAYNPDVQQKAQEEIDRVLAKHDSKLSYDALSEMTYLKWCLDESLRIFPPVTIVQRRCVRPYTFPDLKLTIDADVNVIIPVAAYQNDPNYFPEPQEFRPERFDPSVMTAQQKMAYLPFGDGPRACIGERLGLMQSLAGLAAVLAQFSVTPAPGAPRDLVLDPLSRVTQSIKGGLPLIFHERKAQ